MILFISDLHKSLDDKEEIESVKWLLKILDELKPDYLIGAGDWGEGMSAADFSDILSRTKLIAVYGNHENFSMAKNFSIRDGQIISVGAMKVAGINGLIGDDENYGISPNKFLKIISRLRDKNVDVLITHQPPYLPEIYPK
jgi:Predicted phosphoesterase